MMVQYTRAVGFEDAEITPMFSNRKTTKEKHTLYKNLFSVIMLVV